MGVVLLIAAMGLNYHNDQTLADRTLATKVDLPAPVRIQDFSRTANSNLLGELQVLAEADISQSALKSFPFDDTVEKYLLLPIYPVTEGANARARTAIDPDDMRPHRPVPRRARIAQDDPLAVLVYDVTETHLRPRTIETFGLTRLGRGFNGDLVLIGGVAFTRALLSEGATQGQLEIAARDAFDLPADAAVPLIAPHVTYRLAPGRTDMTNARNFLASLASMALLFAVSLLFREISGRPAERKSMGARRPNQTGSRPSSTFFDPLMPQDEIQKAENESRVTSELSFTRLSRRLGPAFSRIRSRR